MRRLCSLIFLCLTPIAAQTQTIECNVVKFCHLDDPCQTPPVETWIDLDIDENARSAVYSPRGGSSLQLKQIDGSLPQTLHYAGKDAGAGAVFVSMFPSRHAIFVHHSLIEDVPGSITFLTRCEDS